ncbi:class I adenylate-forming enzyme family protein [Pseudonocardia sp. TRM90224]|uniref:class I adenylate-forming enzyme family protein n=1 Tax=Pseudonocardia sp. TRM90224 TaxID=2812678 RepID=UPI001E3210DB|nr:class I adenylate-forming enzyme family protein [Pseudonocardia sp. TRM90224]
MSEPVGRWPLVPFDDRLAAALAAGPADAVAVVDEDASPPRTVTFAQLRAMVEEFRAQLVALGVGPGHLAPILARPSPECVALILALLRERAAFCVLSERFTAVERVDLVERMQPVGLVVDGPGAALIAQEEGYHPILLEVAGADRPAGWAHPVLSLSAPVAPPAPRTGSAAFDGIAHAHFSSGSTGGPKAVLGTRDGLSHFADVQIDGCGLTAADRLLCIVGFGSNLGLVQIFSALFSGASLHLTRARDRALGEIIRRAGITGLGGSTPLWTAALAATAGHDTLFGDVPTLRYISTGGLHMPRTRFSELITRLGGDVAVYEIFGQAEVRQMTHFPISAAEHTPRFGSVGRAVAGSHLFVTIDEETVAPTGTVGEVAHWGPGVMAGYLGRPELTATVLRTHAAFPGRTVVYTGDLGYQDHDGYVFLKGRESRAVQMEDGQTVWPATVEDALATFPGITDSIAVGVGSGGRTVLAAAVVATGAVDPIAVREHIAAQLPAQAVPVHIAVWPALPSTPNGKPAVALITSRLAAELVAELTTELSGDRAG